MKAILHTQVTETTQQSIDPSEPQLTLEPCIKPEDTCMVCPFRAEGSIARTRGKNPSKPTSFCNKIQITRREMAKYFSYPQRLAAQKLGVSVSTLKRRFYQLGIGRWPYQLMQEKRRSNLWSLVSDVESQSEKELSPNTVQTLTRLFSMSLQDQQLLATENPSPQRNISNSGAGSPNLKFLQYVPKCETSVQPQNQNSSIPSSNSNVIHKRS